MWLMEEKGWLNILKKPRKKEKGRRRGGGGGLTYGIIQFGLKTDLAIDKMIRTFSALFLLKKILRIHILITCIYMYCMILTSRMRWLRNSGDFYT